MGAIGTVTTTARKLVASASFALTLCLTAAANLHGAESDAIIAGAQKEGELVTWAVGEIAFQTMVVDRFKKKYPFIKKVVGRDKGLDFMRRLARQDLQYRGGHSQMVQLLAAGEFPIIAVAYGPRVSVVRANGAPIDWAALNPVFSNPIGMALYKNAPHPNAAKLYIDFMLSKEIQQEIWVDAAWKGSARRDVVAKDPRWQGIKVIPLDLTFAQRYQEVAKEFQQVFKPHG